MTYKELMQFTDEVELMERQSGGLDISLVCDRSFGLNSLRVIVQDRVQHKTDVVNVLEGENIMDVFHHPFAYMAFHETLELPIAA
ncbi:MAG TPA: hypothetical protein VLF63_03690 [Patescibacteria group bacterium]|nr:hypothetical protein [Patescibacteria group bacterium]